MYNKLINALGWVGCTLLTLNMIPQIYKIHITKKAGDISTTFIVVNIIGLVSYSIYGWYNNLVHIAISTTLSSFFSGYMLTLKYLYTNQEFD